MAAHPPADDTFGVSVSRLLDRFRHGSESAYADIVARLLPTAAAYARRRMGADLGKAVDPEDLALSALHSLWCCVSQQREAASRLADSGDLRRLLAHITRQKVRRARRFHTQQKRDVRRTVRDADASVEAGSEPLLTTVPNGEPPPDREAVYQDTLADWLADLQPLQQAIVRYRLDGFENREIAGVLSCSLRTVERHLSEIRSRWSERIASGTDTDPTG